MPDLLGDLMVGVTGSEAEDGAADFTKTMLELGEKRVQALEEQRATLLDQRDEILASFAAVIKEVTSEITRVRRAVASLDSSERPKKKKTSHSSISPGRLAYVRELIETNFAMDETFTNKDIHALAPGIATSAISVATKRLASEVIGHAFKAGNTQHWRRI